MLPPDLDRIALHAYLLFLDLLAQDEDGQQFPDLLTTEGWVLTFTQQLGHRMMQTFADVRAAQALAKRAPCACGRRREVLQQRSWPHKTLLGAITVSDPYTYCRTCHEKERPAQARLGTNRQTWSLRVQEAAVDLASDESCGKAVAKLARHHPGVQMERTTALRLLHQHGAAARVFINDTLAAARTGALAGQLPEQPAPELEAEYDASMIPVATLVPVETPAGEEPRRTPVRGLPVRTKNAHWEEVKAGLVQRPGDEQRLYALRPTRELDAAFADLFGLAALQGWTKETKVRGLADGAVYIRTRMEAAFAEGDFQFILDRPHCKEHLSEAGTLLEPLTGVAASSWAEQALRKLENGQASDVVAELQVAYEQSGKDEAARIDGLRLAAGYIERNQDAVAYASYREKGWSTASSEIESGHRHVVQARLKISGAWWHPDRVDDILALRMLKANGWWDEYWSRQRQEWRERAQTFAQRRPAIAA